MNYPEENPKKSEEVNLIDYIRVIFKRKRLILGFFIIGLIIGVGSVWLLSKAVKIEKVQRVETFLVIGGVLDDLPEIAAKTNIGFYKDYPGIEAENLERTNLLRIKIITRKPEEAKEALKNINDSILEDHTNQMNLKRESLERYKERLEKDINYLILRGQQIVILQEELYSIENSLENLQPTKVIQEPTAKPIKKEKGELIIGVEGKEPNLILNLIFGGILGILVGISLAFCKDWWDKNKHKLKS